MYFLTFPLIFTLHERVPSKKAVTVPAGRCKIAIELAGFSGIIAHSNAVFPGRFAKVRPISAVSAVSVLRDAANSDTIWNTVASRR
jgi:hypothetical protein